MVPGEIEEVAAEFVSSFRRRQVNENLLHRLSQTLFSAVPLIKDEEQMEPMDDWFVHLYNCLFKLRQLLDTFDDEHISEQKRRELEEITSEIEEHLATFSDPESYDAADQWQKTERIGSGGYGIVHVGLNRITGELCAIKEMIGIDDPKTAKSLQQEIQILSRLEHRNIVKYYGSNRVAGQVSIYMEYVQPGSLKKYIRSRGALQQPLVRNLTAQILSGLAYYTGKE